MDPPHQIETQQASQPTSKGQDHQPTPARTKTTLDACRRLSRSCLRVIPGGPTWLLHITTSIVEHKIRVLNVAGNWAMIQMPCQIVRSGRRLIYRLLSWNPWQGVFLRLVERLHGRCSGWCTRRTPPPWCQPQAVLV